MKWARGRAPTLASGAVLYAVCDYATPEGVAWPSQESIAHAISPAVSERTARDNLRVLERELLIARIRRHSRAGYRTSDWIVIAPLAADRGEMEDVDDDAIAHGRWPEAVGQLARKCDDEEERTRLFRVYLPESGSGRSAANGHVTPERLPGSGSKPTGVSFHPYRSDIPRLPESGSGELLVEPGKERSFDLTPYVRPEEKTPSPQQQPSERTTTGGGASSRSFDAVEEEEGRTAADLFSDSGNSNDSPRRPVELVPGSDGLIPPSRILGSFDRKGQRWDGECELARTLGVELAQVADLTLEQLLEAVTA
jgi:hypothetical protein